VIAAEKSCEEPVHPFEVNGEIERVSHPRILELVAPRVTRVASIVSSNSASVLRRRADSALKRAVESSQVATAERPSNRIAAASGSGGPKGLRKGNWACIREFRTRSVSRFRVLASRLDRSASPPSDCGNRVAHAAHPIGFTNGGLPFPHKEGAFSF
jgi:hypothetical protein